MAEDHSTDDIDGKVDDSTLISHAVNSDIPHVYCNGFSTILSNGDVLTILQNNGNNVATLNMSFTVAKTLSVALGQLIGALENATEREIMTLADINAARELDEQK